MAQERREKGCRDRRDVLQKHVAKAIGTTGATVSRWEGGKVMPNDEVIVRLARYFGVTPAWLRFGQEPRAAPSRTMERDPRKQKPNELEPAGEKAAGSDR